MLIIEDISDLSPNLPCPVITWGMFDGIHRGHQKILQSLVEDARSRKGTGIVLTFREHPQKLLEEKTIPILTGDRQKSAYFASIDIDIHLNIPFNRELSEMTAEEFTRDFLHKQLGVKGIHLGEDAVFGKGRQGNTKLLEDLSKSLDFSLTSLSVDYSKDEQISSTRIREHLKNGDLEAAEGLLGRPYQLEGSVCKGNGRGRELGYPTANIDTGSMLLPPNGVYWGKTFIEEKVHLAMINIGTRPTFEEDQKKICEVHILNYSGDLYDRTLSVALLGRIRKEKKFSSAGELREQIEKDITQAREEEKSKTFKQECLL